MKERETPKEENERTENPNQRHEFFGVLLLLKVAFAQGTLVFLLGPLDVARVEVRHHLVEHDISLGGLEEVGGLLQQRGDAPVGDLLVRVMGHLGRHVVDPLLLLPQLLGLLGKLLGAQFDLRLDVAEGDLVFLQQEPLLPHLLLVGLKGSLDAHLEVAQI